MAHYSVHIGTVQRSKGENAIASAAYISRSKLSLTITDKHTNVSWEQTWDYTKKGGLAFSKIYLPVQDAPDWMHNREKLWNKAEQAEARVESHKGT